jgi:hypothetical protein
VTTAAETAAAFVVALVVTRAAYPQLRRWWQR